MKKQMILGLGILLILGVGLFLMALLGATQVVGSRALSRSVEEKISEYASTRTTSFVLSQAVEQKTKLPIKSALLVEATNPQSSPSPASPELMLPIFYKMKDGNFDKLTKEESSEVIYCREQYLDFYTQWMNTYPHDLNAWNDKMRELEFELGEHISDESMSRLMTP